MTCLIPFSFVWYASFIGNMKNVMSHVWMSHVTHTNNSFFIRVICLIHISFVWPDLSDSYFIHVTCLIHISFMWHVSFMFHSCDLSRSCFVRVTCLVHISFVWHACFIFSSCEISQSFSFVRHVIVIFRSWQIKCRWLIFVRIRDSCVFSLMTHVSIHSCDMS